jgi:membrane dipeptidase
MAGRLLLLFAFMCMWGCSSLDDIQKKQAERLAQDILILDAHMDVPYRLRNHMENIAESTTTGNFDYPRARAGGLDAVFMAIFVPPGYEGKEGSKGLADSMMDMVEDIAARSPDKFAMARSVDDVRENFAAKKISFLLGIENGAAIEDDITNVRHFYDRGVRYITLTHSKDNNICDSSFDSTGTWKGLSSFGREVVLEMNRLGCMIDVSHASDEAFYQIIELSRAPVIATHSCCRVFTPGLERNMSDDMIRALSRKGGVMHLNFSSMFLVDECRRQVERERKDVSAYLKTNGLAWDSEERRAYEKAYRRDHPVAYGDVSDLVKQIDHIVEIAGIDHVGFGSDFDGVGDLLPAGMKDVSCYPAIIYALIKKGYSEAEIKKIASGNTLRVWNAVKEVARSSD